MIPIVGCAKLNLEAVQDASHISARCAKASPLMQGLNIHGTHSFSMCSYVYILLTTRPGLQPLPEITVTKSVHVLLLEGHVVLRLTYASAGGRMVETASFLYSQECVEGLLPQTCSHHTFQETMRQRENFCFHKLEKLMGEDLKRQFPNDLTYKS